MSFKFGWFSTGRDPAARELLTIVVDNCKSGFIPGEISFVFCSREEGEHPESDAFIKMVEDFGLDLLCFSSKKFKPDLWQEGKNDLIKREIWRSEYDARIFNLLSEKEHDIDVLAGYMLIVSDTLCECYKMVNLHPATPDGPKGTWQEVIWELIQTNADETGVMMHLVTKELDRGPPITYCSFPIKGGLFSTPLQDLNNKLESSDLREIQENEGEEEPYFHLVREEGVRRELPLIIFTLRTLANGTVVIKNQNVFEGEKQLEGGYDLSSEIEDYIKQ